jgi:hypothetical protein
MAAVLFEWLWTQKYKANIKFRKITSPYCEIIIAKPLLQNDNTIVI